MSSTQELHLLANQWIKAFNDKNIESLLALYDNEATHFSPRLKKMHPETNGLITGKKAMYKWWQEAFNRLPDLQYKPIHIVAENEIIYLEYTRITAGEENQIINERLIVKNKLIVNSKVL